jgi:hypothetical protein
MIKAFGWFVLERLVCLPTRLFMGATKCSIEVTGQFIQWHELLQTKLMQSAIRIRDKSEERLAVRSDGWGWPMGLVITLEVGQL